MSNLKKDIEELLEDMPNAWCVDCEHPICLDKKELATTQIINLIESVIKESMVKELGKLEHNKRFFHKGIHVVAVSSIEERLAGLKGEYIKSKLIGKE